MDCLADDLDALLVIHRIPHRHRINVRTTNLAERSLSKNGAAPRSSPDSPTNAPR
jgi:hypothetical protein